MNQNAKRPRLSVVIPCLNEEDYIGKLLDDLVNQMSISDLEVIVVDSSSEDNTVKVAEKFADKLPLTILKLKKRGVSRARNAGATTAKGEWLFFFDADVRIDPGYLKMVYEYLESHEVDFGTSKYGTHSWHPFDQLFFWGWSHGFQYSYEKGDYLMNGSTIFIKRSLHRQIGGFNEEMEIGEDIDYAKRLAAVNTNGIFVPAKMYLSNRRLVQRGRIMAMLMVAGWNNLIPGRLARFVNRDYFEKRKEPMLWRKVVRVLLNLVALGTIIYLVSSVVVN